MLKQWEFRAYANSVLKFIEGNKPMSFKGGFTGNEVYLIKAMNRLEKRTNAILHKLNDTKKGD